MLEAVGVPREEELVYEALLDQPGATLPDVARACHITQNEARRLLSALEERGLASRSPGRVGRYVPAPPESAIEILILRRQEDLATIRMAASQLAERLRSSTNGSHAAELLEVVSGREAIRQRFRQLQQSTEHELLAFDKPPYITCPPSNDPTAVEQRDRKVRYRIVYERSALEVPGGAASVESGIRGGEDARVFPELPVKLDISDGRVALMELSMDRPDTPSAVVVRVPILVRTLVMFFEMVWQQAIPLRAGDAPSSSSGTAELEEEDRRILSLLAAGMKDEAIARQLGIGHRTARRRVHKMMELLHVDTRFQAGLQAARRGWL